MGPTGPQLLAPAVGWRAVHDGALRAPAALLYTMGPFGPPLLCCTQWGPLGPRCCAVHDGALRAPIAHGAAQRRRMTKKKKKKIGSRLKKSNFFFFFAKKKNFWRWCHC